MRNTAICASALLALVATSPLYAQQENEGGLFVEPMITYENLDSKVNYPNPFGDTKGELSGLGAGLRLGGHVFDTIFIGLDGRYSRPEYSANNGDYTADATAYNYGLVAGVQLPTPISLRVWGGYILGGEFDPERANNVDMRFEKGTGYRVGAGLMLAMVSINLEYQRINYDKAVLESVGPFDPNDSFNDVEAKNDGYVLSVSFPLSL